VPLLESAPHLYVEIWYYELKATQKPQSALQCSGAINANDDAMTDRLTDRPTGLTD